MALLVVSLGPQVEGRARELLARREAFAGFMLDRMGSYLAEWCMADLDRQVAERLSAQSCATTRRYSPGYQDFALEAQRAFVDLVGEVIPGLALEPGNLLRPEKSISAIKGVTSGP